MTRRQGWTFGAFIGGTEYLTVPGSAYKRPELFGTWGEADAALSESGLRSNPYQDFTVAYVTEVLHGGVTLGCAYLVTDAPDASMVVREVYRQGDGTVRAAEIVSAAGGRLTVQLGRGQVSWADAEVWAHPERHGLERYTCPGHGGAVCQYGACDEIRLTDVDGLRVMVRELASV